MTQPDPFGTADLRRVVLDAWTASAARFREDANAEDLLAAGGYAGRALVELAANGVDAARDAGVPARLRIRLVDGELRVANVGTSLSAAGVAGLASLRASTKRGAAGSVGFFGVGFTAVIGWADSARVMSTTGGVRFDAAATLAAVRGRSVPLDEELALRGDHVPVLRLPFPVERTEVPPPDGWTTEVRLPLRAGARGEVAVLLADPDTAPDLLWALPELTEIDLPDRVVRRHTGPDGTVELHDGTRTDSFRLVTRSGEMPAELLAGRPVEQRGRARWTLHWVQALTGTPTPSSIVGAPTPTDESLTLPARLVGTLPVDDTRRRLAPGPMLDHLLDQAADLYLDLVRSVDPVDRWRLLPTGFPLGSVDADLRARIVGRVESEPLLRTAAGDPVRIADAGLLPGVDDAGAALIAEALPGLLPPTSPAAVTVLKPLGLSTLTWSQVSAALAGLDRPAAFWRRVYRAAADAVPPPRPDDLADIPVPLIGGRRAIGARGCLLPAGVTDGSAGGSAGVEDDLARRIGAVVPGLRVVDPEAAHPLLARLGAKPAEPSAVLADPALAERVERLRRDLEDVDLDPDEVGSVAEVVLALLAAGAVPVAGVLADLVLTDEDGNPWPAAELLLPGAPLADLLDPEVDRVVVEPVWARRAGTEVLVSAGVRDGVPVVVVADPIPDALADRLPDLDDWLDLGVIEAGEAFVALADLDLIHDSRWPEALTLIAGDPRTRECLRPSAAGPSYSGWWLARHATLHGHPPGHWRLPGAADLAGLYDPLPGDLDENVARWIGVRADLASAAAVDPTGLLDRLADPDRSLAPARVASLTAAVVAALDGSDIDLPDGVRTLGGEVVDADLVLVLDQPWWAQVIEPGRLAPGGQDPESVARVLDLRLASANGPVRVSTGGTAPTGAESCWIRAAGAMGLDPEGVPLTIAATIDVAVAGGEPRAASWWCDRRYYSDGSAESLGRVAAWAAGRWSDRQLAVAAAARDLVALAECGLD